MIEPISKRVRPFDAPFFKTIFEIIKFIKQYFLILTILEIILASSKGSKLSI
jgi:hypothetical protein